MLPGDARAVSPFNPAYGPAPDATRKKLVVTTTSDATNGSVASWDALVANPGADGISLREALTVAQLTTGPKEIGFDPALRGATIAVFSEVKARLPFLTSGDLVLDGDIDHDGQPDITIDGAAGKGAVGTPLCFLVWSSRNHLNGLRLQNFASYQILLSPHSLNATRSATGNRFTNCWIDASASSQAGVHMDAVGYFPATLINGFVWTDTLIAGNRIVASLNAGGVVMGAALGDSRNQLIGTTIQDNNISGGGILVYCADANSTFVAENQPPKNEPEVYSDDNLIKDTLIKNNRITDGRYGGKSIEIAVANDGNSRNKISNVTVFGNSITIASGSLNDGIVLQSSRPLDAKRPGEGNVLEGVLIEKNVIENPRCGISATVSGDRSAAARPAFPGEWNNRIDNLVVRQNTIRGYTWVGIEVFAGRGNTAPETVRDNQMTGLEIVENTITTTQRNAPAGIWVMAGLTLNDNGRQGSGPARFNAIESAKITGNQLVGGSVSIQVMGGRGPGAEANRITGLLIADNAVEVPPIVVANDSGASGNIVELLPPPSRLINISTRGLIPAGGTLTPGFVMRGTGSKRLVIRAVGPTLAAFGIGAALADPKLDVFAQGATSAMLANDDWGGTASLRNACASVGAFPLDAASRDAAMETSLAVTGSGHTVRVAPVDATASGIALAEVYDADPASSPVRLVNVSTLGFAGTGEDVLTAGFVVGGTGRKSLLIRAVGPGLAQFGVTGWLVDPRLQVLPAGQATAVAGNDHWGGTAALKSAFTAAGAFVLPEASKDAAVFTILPPGGYTVVVNGAGTTTGTALVEIYDLDP